MKGSSTQHHPDSDASVSVIIPTFDRAGYVVEAVRSVLDQTHPVLEVLVIDDDSTDDTVEALRRLDDQRVVIVRHARCNNPARLRNVGLGLARGRYAAFLDSDDLWRPGKVAAQLSGLRQRPESRWSYTLFDHIDGAGRSMPAIQGGPWSAEDGWVLERMLQTDILVLIPTVMVEARFGQRVGGFDEQFRFGEDYDFVLRLAAAGPAAAAPDALVRIRHHPARTTSGMPGCLGWPEVYAKQQVRASSAGVRTICRTRRGTVLIQHASYYSHKRYHGSAFRCLARSLPAAVSRVDWWIAALKAGARALLRRGPPVGSSLA